MARNSQRQTYVRRRVIATLVLLSISAAVCLGVRAAASRGDGAASLPTVTPTGSAVLYTTVDPTAARLGTAGANGAFTGSQQFYVVQPGDTLWSIASSLTTGNISSFVRDLVELNGSASVAVGQKLALPAD